MEQPYRVKVYAYLVEIGRREIKSLPEEYKVPVAEYIVEQIEKPKNS
ncbi:CD1375 family protein [Brevibacillus laterosporus]|nr:CD1375 family protein [Brevibacillus laterosporus]